MSGDATARRTDKEHRHSPPLGTPTWRQLGAADLIPEAAARKTRTASAQRRPRDGAGLGPRLGDQSAVGRPDRRRPAAWAKPPPVDPAKLATATQTPWSAATRRARSGWTADSPRTPGRRPRTRRSRGRRSRPRAAGSRCPCRSPGPAASRRPRARPAVARHEPGGLHLAQPHLSVGHLVPGLYGEHRDWGPPRRARVRPPAPVPVAAQVATRGASCGSSAAERRSPTRNP